MSNRQQQQLSDYELLQSQLVNCKVSFKKLYTELLKSCLEHDLTYMRPDINANSRTSEILSDEAKILLKVFGKKWLVGDAFQVISYLEQVFYMHQNNKVPIPVVVATFDVLHDCMKIDGWLPAYEVGFNIPLHIYYYYYYYIHIVSYTYDILHIIFN